MKSSRQIAVYFLLTTAALPFFAFLFFIGQRQYLRWQMEEKLEKEQLTTITIAANDFRWYKEGKEIVVNGHLFDVEEIQKLRDGKLLITGLYDYQEQKLHKQMEGWMSQTGDTSNRGKNAFIKWLSHLYDNEIQDLNVLHLPFNLKENKFPFSTSLISIITDVLTPPPRF